MLVNYMALLNPVDLQYAVILPLEHRLPLIRLRLLSHNKASHSL
jgi:hypothetical protein